MATKVTLVSGTAEVKRREKRDERSEGGVESVPTVQPVTFVDGKCTCCPYGYHIDLDFLNFCKNVADGSTLHNLKRIQRTKRKLRKSMEVMLHQQQGHGDSATATLTLSATPPPDVVHSTEASRLINMVQYEQSATHQVLRDIDSSVNATLASIHTVQQSKGPGHNQRYMSSDSEDGYSYSPISPVSASSLHSHSQQQKYHAFASAQAPAPPPRRSSLHHSHHSNGDESSHFATSLSTSGRTDSLTSLSSVSTVSSEQVVGGQYTSHASGMLSAQPNEMATAQIRRSHATTATAMTSEKLAATMATHFPQGERDGRESPSSPMSPDTTIGKASLAAIREAMAVSLQRMRDLEEQVKAIPILQVRISVLKEEKRLLALQLKAKSSSGTSASVRSVGVGEDSVDSPGVFPQAFPYPTASSPFAPLASSPRSPGLKSPPATLPKPSRVKTVGVGEHSVIEPYLLQPDLPTGYTITDNQVLNEIRTSVYEKEVVFGSLDRRLGSASQRRAQQLSASEDMLDSTVHSPTQATHFTINQIQRSIPKPMTRSIGVGEGNVHDTSLQIHEKELRTVIIGGSGGPVGKRNVGVEVRPAMRSVGVSYTCDEAKPSTRTIGVNVTYDMTDIHTSLDFKGEEELRMALRGVLQRNVRSIGTFCDFRPILMHTGVQHESFSTVSVGCGGDDCRVDVDIRQPVVQRSMGVTVKPEVASRTVGTEKGWVLDMGTNTPVPEMYNKASNTESRRMGTVSTNTEQTLRRKIATQTDVRVFQSMELLRSTGSNTVSTPTTNSSCNTITPITNHRGVNTKSPDLVMENFDFNIAFDSKASNTPREFRDVSVNTSSRDSQLSLSRVECVDVAGEEVQAAPKRPLTMQEQILQRGASQATAFLGSTSSSGSLSPTSPGGNKSLLQDEESVSRSVVETVYTSPVTSRQVWSSQSGSGGGSSAIQTQVVRSSSSGGGQLTSTDMDTGDGGGGSGGYSRSTVTRTITSKGGSAGGLSSEGGTLLSGDLDTGDSDGGYSSRIITKTYTSRSGGGSGRTGETKITKTVTTSGGEGGSHTTTEVMTGPESASRTPGTAFSEIDDTYTARKRAAGITGDLSGGSSYLERFGLGRTSNQSNAEETVITETSESTSMDTGGDLSMAGLEVREGTASLQSAAMDSAQSGQVVMMGGTEGADQADSESFSSVSSSGRLSSGQPDLVSETVVVKRSLGGGGNRLTKHRHSDGGRISRELAMDLQGAFSGQRVGSVEDFMPDDMRRLMNIETSGSGGKSGKSDKNAKNVRTVTTKKISGDGSTVTVTKTITNPDGTTTTTTTTDVDVDELIPQGQGLGKLSTGRFDLSKLTEDDGDSMMDSGTGDSQGSAERLEGGGIKDSGYYDSSSMSTVSQSSSMPGFDLESMGSLERRQLKSIMKKSKSDSANPKKGITFAESVVGGTGSSSEEGDTESDDDSTTSFEEGSYDGREGDIIYQCRDDEAIAQGLPGAKMYDQNIRETSIDAIRRARDSYELSEEMRKSCEVLASYLVDSTTIQTKELNANLSIVQEEWFRVSSHKLSSGHQVEDYLSSIKEISNRLLEYIVNLVDSNGNEAIHYCVSHGNFDIAGLLLDTEVCDVKRPNKAGYTPAMLAALTYVQNDEHRDVIRRLFAAGDINAIAERTGQTALMLATSQCREDMVHLLLEAGADCNMQDFDGSTALMCACEHGHAAIVQMLLAQPDCDANLTDNEGSTALSIAMEAGHKDIGVILYKHVNFSKPASPGFQKKRKGPSSPTPRHLVH